MATLKEQSPLRTCSPPNSIRHWSYLFITGSVDFDRALLAVLAMVPVVMLLVMLMVVVLVG